MKNLASSLQPNRAFAINHASDIATVRRAGRRMAHDLGFNEARAGDLTLLIGEAATNILKHAGAGHVYMTVANCEGFCGVDVLALDRGPGIANISKALRGGGTTAGVFSTGLAVMRRLADEFDLYAPPGKGAALFMRVWQSPAPAVPLSSGALCIPIASEDECGDAWAMASHRAGVSLMSIDGIGHGPEAAAAARAAVDALAARPALAPSAQIDACHRVLRETIGAAMAVAHIDFETHELRFAGIGNISACIVDGDSRKQMASHNGVVGHNMRKVQEFTHPCAPGALIILHSDGISDKWDLASYPGLSGCNPALIAAVLLRDFVRQRDDANVLVVRYMADRLN
jgi:anti-sigma regulatory factor (Ser/Thr protein kinase)